VFIPLLLMSGIVGRLFREFAITVTITIVISAIISLTLTPMMGSRFLKHETHRHGRIYNLVEGLFDGMLGFYKRTLDVVLRFQFLTLLVFVATVSLTVYLYIIIPKGFFPTQDTGIIIGITEVAEDASYEQMARLQQAVNAVVMKNPAVYSVVSSVGAGSGGQTANNGRLYITLKPWDQRASGVMQVIGQLDRATAPIPGIRLFMQPAQDVRVGARLTKTLYQYTIQDSNQDELNAWAPKILAHMRKIPLLTDVTSDQENSGTTVTMTINREQAERFGIMPATIDDILYDAFGQREVSQYFTGNKAYYVILETQPNEFGKIDTLGKLYVDSSTGVAVPLSTLVTTTTVPVEPLAINHQSQFPSVTVSFNLKGNASLGDVVTQVDAMKAAIGVPSTVEGSFQGTAQAFQASLSSEPVLVPLTILSTLPSAGVGALLMLLIFGYQLTVIALIGIILLIGIVKKNGIMMVDFAITAERRDGLSPHDAIRQACLLRFRPILMTTMAAMLSGLPLMLESGAGSEIRKPLGFAMVGGLALSQVLTLYTTPVIYLYLDRLQNWMSPAQSKRRLPSLAEKMQPAASNAD
jgi:multidrug efflux pump subunit AcrB